MSTFLHNHKSITKPTMAKNGKLLKWKISFHHRSTPSLSQSPPPEYICSLCNSLISNPIIVTSGHTFHPICVQVCQHLHFSPTLPDGTRPDFSTTIPNLALHSSILNWCSQNGVALPPEKDYATVEMIVKELMLRSSEKFLIDSVKDKPDPGLTHAITELTHRVNSSSSSSTSSTLLPFATKPACWSPYDSSSPETLNPDIFNPNSSPDDEFIATFNRSDPIDQEQGAISLRNATRIDENARISLCTPRLLLSLGSLLISSYEKVQSNAMAALVNLSLEKTNKIKIVRSGIVPIVIDLLKGSSSECQEIAAGAIFSLSLEDQNKTAIGVLGALPPLLNCLTRSNSERTRCDSALALYHLSLVYSNRVKLVKLGAVPALLTAMRSKSVAVSGRVLLVLCELAASTEGKMAMLDGNAVWHLVTMLRSELRSEWTREKCVDALYAMSHGSMRFKAAAKMAGAVEVMKEVQEMGNERAKEKAKRILMLLKGWSEKSDIGGGVVVYWEAIRESDGLNRTHHRVEGCDGVGKSTEF